MWATEPPYRLLPRVTPSKEDNGVAGLARAPDPVAAERFFISLFPSLHPLAHRVRGTRWIVTCVGNKERTLPRSFYLVRASFDRHQ